MDIREKIYEAIKNFLFEVKSSELKQKYPQLSNKIDDALNKGLPNKFLVAFIKLITNEEKNDEMDVINVLKELDNLEKLGKIDKAIKLGLLDAKNAKNIDWWIKNGLKQMKNAIEVINQKEEIKSKKEKKEESKKNTIYEDEENKIYYVEKVEDLNALCSGKTHWCINQPKFWDNYKKKGAKFYVILNEKNEYPNNRIIVVVYENYIEVYDANDKIMYLSQVNNIVGNAWKKLEGYLNKIYSLDFKYSELFAMMAKENKNIINEEYAYYSKDNEGTLIEYFLTGYAQFHGGAVKRLTNSELEKIKENNSRTSNDEKIEQILNKEFERRKEPEDIEGYLKKFEESDEKNKYKMLERLLTGKKYGIFKEIFKNSKNISDKILEIIRNMVVKLKEDELLQVVDEYIKNKILISRK